MLTTDAARPAFTLYREQYRMAISKSHGAGKACRDSARFQARSGFFIARRIVWPSFEAYWARITKGLDLPARSAKP